MLKRAPDRPDRVTIADAMQVLGVSRTTIYRLIRIGELTPIKLKVGRGRGARHVFFERAQVETLRDAVKLDEGGDSR